MIQLKYNYIDSDHMKIMATESIFKMINYFNICLLVFLNLGLQYLYIFNSLACLFPDSVVFFL